MDLDTAITYTIIDLVLRGIWIKVLFIIWMVSLFLARRRGDHARVAFTYMKAAFPFLILSLILFVSGDAVSIVQYTLENSSSFNYEGTTSDRNTDILLGNISLRLNTVGLLSQGIANILVLFCQVELGNGFLFCLTQLRTTFQKALRYGAIAAGILLFALLLARLGIINAQYTKYFDYLSSQVYTLDFTTGEYYVSGPSFDYVSFNSNLRKGLDLGVAYDVFMFVIAVGLLAYAAYVAYAVRSMPYLNNSAIIFIVIAVLQLIRYTWAIALDAAWLLRRLDIPWAYSSIVDPILGTWTFSVVMILLFVISIRKQKGLWTTPQPWMSQNWAAPAPMQPQYPGSFPPQQMAGLQQPMAYAPQNNAYHVSPQYVQQQQQVPVYSMPPGGLQQPGLGHEMK